MAKAINASPGQIHHHFASASDLRAEAFTTAINRVAPPDMASLTSMARVIVTLVGENDAWDVQMAGLWNEALVVAHKDEIVRKALGRLMQQWVHTLEKVISDGQSARDFRTDVEPHVIARRLIALSIGLDLLTSLESESPSSNKEIEDTVMRELVTSGT